MASPVVSKRRMTETEPPSSQLSLGRLTRSQTRLLNEAGIGPDSLLGSPEQQQSSDIPPPRQPRKKKAPAPPPPSPLPEPMLQSFIGPRGAELARMVMRVATEAVKKQERRRVMPLATSSR